MTEVRRDRSVYESGTHRHDGAQDQRSLSELFSELSHEMSTLVRQEMQLATLELKKKATKATIDATWLAVGGLILYAGVLGLMITAIIALAYVMEPWLAALIVAVVFCAAGGYLMYYGYNQLKQIDMVPHRTVETVQENAEWMS
jgi:uncharacterized membrane protein